MSLADKINSLINVAPTNFDSESDDEATKAKVVDVHREDDDCSSEQEPSTSSFRRQNISTLDEIDERYEGKKVSRKDIYEEENVESSENDESASEKEDESGSSEQEESDEEEESGEEQKSFDEDNPLRRKRDPESHFQCVSETNVRGDVDKGNCAREQLKLWETMLEFRIKMQKCLVGSNKMPQSEQLKSYREDKEFSKQLDKTTSNLGNLLNKMLDLQETLLKGFPETKDLLKGGGSAKSVESPEDDPMDEEIPSDTDDEQQENEESDEGEKQEVKPRKMRKLEDYEKILDKRHKCYRDYRNGTVQKWNDRVRVASGSIKKGLNQAVVKQIEFALSDRPKLLKRTRLKRSDYEIIGKNTIEEDNDGRRTQEYDNEIFDDDDFYHQLLRDLIEYKSSGVTDPIQLGKQWVQLQNMRSKMKRKIDTRATKGRRVRYDVHNKLVNFMAPITYNDSWSDLTKNELYNSLFGKFTPSEAT